MSDKIKTLLCNITGNFPRQIRRKVYRYSGLTSIGADLRRRIRFDHVNNVKIGQNSMINQNVQFHIGDSEEAHIVIGDNVYVGMNTVFICVSHKMGDSSKRAGTNTYSDIYINDGVWIGANVVILPGVNIGKGCVIAAGSIVISDCEENCLYAGNPSRNMKKLV